jgi:hypothetical protein
MMNMSAKSEDSNHKPSATSVLLTQEVGADWAILHYWKSSNYTVPCGVFVDQEQQVSIQSSVIFTRIEAE